MAQKESTMQRLFALLSKDITVIAVTIVGILVFVGTANADWTTSDVDGVTVAALEGEIDMDDVHVPFANVYVINSTGGLVAAGFQISDKLQATKATVLFHNAYSIAALIALETDAQPLNSDSQLGFHWTYNPGSKSAETGDVADLVNQRTFKAIVNKLRPRFAAKIIGQLDDIHGSDQSRTLVLANPTSGVVRTIVVD